MTPNLQPTVLELIELKAKIEPLEQRLEVAKELIRAAGADTYSIPGRGTVTVSAPVLRKPKGTEIIIDHEKLEAADEKLKGKLFALGILKTETTYTRASKSKVEIKVEEQIKKAA